MAERNTTDMNREHRTSHRMRTATQGTANPVVSIGLPVYNGGNYLRTALDTILHQSYQNIELIISDNASTDDTAQICREFQANDGRVRFYGNHKNLGAAANYNRVFELARGKYFKWAAHDDVLAPSFIEQAVETLEANSEAVLCCSTTRRISHSGEETGTYISDLSWDASSPACRFEGLVFVRHACVAVFGLIRREALAKTRLIGPYINSDRVLLAELGLHGRLTELSEPLFFRRDHSGSSLRTFPEPRDRVVWFDPKKAPHLAFPEWNEVLGYAGAVARAPLRSADRIKCWMTVARWALMQWRPLLADVKYAALGFLRKK
jgi:glycosyltransferase involved in cell wall biosynthesis